MKRVWMVLVLSVLMLSICFTTVFAASESESNNNKASAKKIKIGEEITGTISDSRDEDWFRFTTPADGYITVNLDHEILSDTRGFWDIRVLQADGVTGVVDHDMCWVVAGNKNGATSQIGLPEGTYYVKLTRHPYEHSAVPYTMWVNFTETAFAEQEPNSDRKKATPIELNQAYAGVVADSRDEDWYQFTLPESGYITVSLDHEILADTRGFWDIQVLQADGVTGVLDYDLSWVILGNKNGATSQLGLPEGTYYVKLTRHPYEHSDANYTMTVNYTASAQAEKEPNAQRDLATDIVLNKDYMGAIASSRDVDYYRVTLTDTKTITLNFYHDALSETRNLWEIVLYEADGVTELGDTAVTGNQNGAWLIENIPAGTYYVKIGFYPYEYSDVTYTINLSEKHDCSGKWTMRAEPTCTEPGVREELCVTCGKSLNTETISPLGHISDNWTVVKEATCVENGFRYGQCNRCQQDVEEAMDLLPHRFGQLTVISGNEVIPPIVKQQTCQNCGFVNTERDWSYIWVTILVALGGVGLIVGIVNYIKALKKN